MVNETEVIREKMEATRGELSDKIEKLEQQVVDTVQGATSTVADAVQGAKEMVESVKDTMEGAMGTVKDTVDSVRDTMENVTGAVGGAVDDVKETFQDAAECVRQTFDLPRQVDQHPWLMMGGAVAVGFVAGKLLPHAPEAARAVGRAAQASGRLAGSALSAAGSAASSAGSWWGTLESMFGPELGRVKELALGTLFGVIRDVAVQAAPESISRQVREIIDSATSKIGGKPVEGAVLSPRPPEEEAHNGPGRRF